MDIEKVNMFQKKMFAEYERRKKEWVLANPTATHLEYEKALRRIAKELEI